MQSEYYIFGDSHVQMFVGVEGFVLVPCGSRTCYQMARHHSHMLKKLRPYEYKDNIIFCFGEIDVRVHIYNKSCGNWDAIEGLIRISALRYTSYVNTLRSTSKWPIEIMSILPTGQQGNHYGLPFFGTEKDRIRITEMLNAELVLHCEHYDIPFVDVYRELINPNGERRKEYIGDSVHLNREAGLIISNILRSRENEISDTYTLQ